MHEQRVASALEAHLRRVTGRANLRLGGLWERLTGGFDTEIYAFDLEDAPSELSGPLVLRLLRHPREVHRARHEIVLHKMLASEGFPVPRLPADTRGATILDRPFMIMERVAGRSLSDEFAADPAARAKPIVERLGRTQAWLHSLDVARMMRVVDEADRDVLGSKPCRLLEDVNALAARTGDEALRSLAGWLEDHKPEPPAVISLCHGDFHPGNVMADRLTVTGVIDWANVAFGHPELDIAVTRLILSTGLAESGQSQELFARFNTAYAQIRPIDEKLVRYYTVLRAARPLARVIALSYGPSLRGAAEDGYAWARPQAYEALRRLILAETGIDGGEQAASPLGGNGGE